LSKNSKENTAEKTTQNGKAACRTGKYTENDKARVKERQREINK
jgi:hypothetical protein